ncbi:Zinc protease PQQL-like [Camellia lanceoleosa]|uniref:Zinc protease PQQL-like n=1 Tax=Camellia lanceoleosa TaxID=1840588 RepID=A0ACC0IJY0_9ERIC|nr:Zinc protease PQQL-like [Camellia lanceoleosa]
MLSIYRLPIGLERVIQTVSADTVKQFYRKWYHLHNMDVIAVGDFSDTQVARVPLHGFSECEISVARALLMLEIESAYLERDQMQVYCHLWSCCAVKFSEAI